MASKQSAKGTGAGTFIAAGAVFAALAAIEIGQQFPAIEQSEQITLVVIGVGAVLGGVVGWFVRRAIRPAPPKPD